MKLLEKELLDFLEAMQFAGYFAYLAMDFAEWSFQPSAGVVAAVVLEMPALAWPDKPMELDTSCRCCKMDL